MLFDNAPTETPTTEPASEQLRGRYIYEGTCMQILGNPEALRRFHSVYQHELHYDWLSTCPGEVARANAQIEKGFLAIRSLDAKSPDNDSDPYHIAVRVAITLNPDFQWVETEAGHEEMYTTMYARAPRRGPAVACPILGRTTPESAPVAPATQGEASGDAVEGGGVAE